MTNVFKFWNATIILLDYVNKVIKTGSNVLNINFKRSSFDLIVSSKE